MNKLAQLFSEPKFQRTLGYYWLIFCIGLNMAVSGPTLPALALQTHARLGDMGQLFLDRRDGRDAGYTARRAAL